MTLEYQIENCAVETVAEEVTEVVTVRHAAGQSGDKNVEKVACRVISVQSPSSVFIRQVTDEASLTQSCSPITALCLGSCVASQHQSVHHQGHCCSFRYERKVWV
jgi:hypothetical protein